MQEQGSQAEDIESSTQEPTFHIEEPPRDQGPAGYSRMLAWALGFVYTIAIGELRLPDAVGTTLLVVPIVAFLYYRSSHSRFIQAVACLSLLLSLTYALYSNVLVLAITDIALFVALLTLLNDACYKSRVENVRQIFQRSLELLLTTLQRFPENFRNYFYFQSLDRTASPSMFITPVVASFGVVLFHLFFAQINHEYAAAMAALIKRCVEILQYLFDLSFLFAWFIQGFCIFYLLQLPRCPASAPVSFLPSLPISRVGVISPMVLITAVFSAFQVKLLFMLQSLLSSFQDFSLYVQRGFWELLVVASLGFAFWLWAYRECEENMTKRGLRVLLVIFLGELLALCVFAGHKLYLLQLVFGLKDQRLFASLAVVLVASSFVASAAVLWRKCSVGDLLQFQVIILLGGVSAFSLINVDAVVTAVHPISFHSQETGMTKDYSYLLTNSYDNVDQWSALIDEVERNPMLLKHPKSYYWGRYSPLCVKGRDRFAKHLYRAESRMRFSGSSEDIRTALRLNFAIVKTNDWIRQNSERIGAFADTINVYSCQVDPLRR